MSAPTGRWFLPSDAAAHLGVPFTSESQFRRESELDTTRYFERGSGAPSFSSFCFVSVLRKAPASWKASANTRLTLPEFTAMCAHLSNEENWTDGEHTVAFNFKKYTFKSLNSHNVSAVFKDGLLYSSSYLQERL